MTKNFLGSFFPFLIDVIRNLLHSTLGFVNHHPLNETCFLFQINKKNFKAENNNVS